MASYRPAPTTLAFTYKTSHPAGTQGLDASDARATITRCHQLLSDLYEAPGSRLANDVLAGYGSLDPAARPAFFNALVEEFSTDSVALQRAAEIYVRAPSDRTLLHLKRAGESPRQELFLRMNAARGGTALLVRMREHLLQGLDDHASWAVVEADLVHVLKAIFNRGFLEFRAIDWETPAPILEKLMEYEAVHAINDWREMRRRLEDDRRCYAFFHPAWPEEPLVFTEVALTSGVCTKVQPVLDPEAAVLDPGSCDAAVFYSITSCQPGLRGFSLGNPLIGRVVDELRAEWPQLRTFATLSPIQGFRQWLATLADSSDNGGKVARLVEKVRSSDWLGDPGVAALLKRDLMTLCAHYLLHEKRDGAPADPVARFHLSNGAKLRQINWLSDVSRAGLERSAGLTASYLYHPTDLERNCQMYGREHRVNATRELERLSRRGAELGVPRPSATIQQISARSSS